MDHNSQTVHEEKEEIKAVTRQRCFFFFSFSLKARLLSFFFMGPGLGNEKKKKVSSFGAERFACSLTLCGRTHKREKEKELMSPHM